MCKIDGWEEENGKIMQGTAFTLTPFTSLLYLKQLVIEITFTQSISLTYKAPTQGGVKVGL